MRQVNRVDMWAVVLGGALALGLGPGCKRNEQQGAGAPPGSSAQPAAGVGKALDTAQAADLRLSPDGKHVTYLVDGQKPRMDGIPPQMLVGELHTAPVAGGAPRKLGNGVTNVPGGSLFSPDGRWALLLAGYSPASQSGELLVADLSAPANEPVSLGRNVTYMLASADGRQVAFVEQGQLKVGPLPEGPFRSVAAGVATAQFTPDGTSLLYKRRLEAAGGLMVVPTAGTEQPRKLVDQVGDYKLAPDGAHLAFTVRNPSSRDVYDLYVASFPKLQPVKVAEGTTVFAFSPDGKWLGRTEGYRPGVKGDLVVGPAAGGAGRKVGEQVEEFSFAPDSKAVGMLERYDDSARAGTMAVAPLSEGETKRVGVRVPNFTWSEDGHQVAFLSRFLKPIYSVDLMLYRLGEEGAVKVGQGVFGYGFTPDTSALLFRTACVREGRACELMKVALEKPKEPPQKVLSGVYSFKLSEDGKRMLVTYARTDSPTYDVAVQNVTTGQHKTLGRGALLPAYFAAQDGSRVVYLQKVPSPGVYVATDVP